jgi:hypothetical protein
MTDVFPGVSNFPFRGPMLYNRDEESEIRFSPCLCVSVVNVFAFTLDLPGSDPQRPLPVSF